MNKVLKQKNINLFRIDDVCDHIPNPALFFRLINLLNKYKIKPLLGVVPLVKDSTITDKKSNFSLEDLNKLIKQKKIIVGLHGHTHKYFASSKSILNLSSKTEFSGLAYEKQKEKIGAGIKILKKRLGIRPEYFFAPSHNYDQNTLKVLKHFDLINVDGINLYPFKKNGVLHIPQQTNSFKECTIIKNGTFTHHFHPKSLTENTLKDLEKFLNTHFAANFEDITANTDYFLSLNKKNSVKSAAYRFNFYIKLKIYKITR